MTPKKMSTPLAPVPAPTAPAKPAAVPQHAVGQVKNVAQPSPMARPPVQASQRVVPTVATGRGMVRTDTHNAANRVPAHAKHKGRGC